MRTLIVDDDQICRKVLGVALAAYGPITEAATGSEAVEAIRKALLEDRRFDLVTLDIAMPDMDGQSALVEIRRLEAVKGLTADQGAKILMTTARTDGKNVLNAFREQCNGYLIKPIDLDKLYRELARLGLITL